MAVFLFSLVGLPPFAGFVGKFYIFASLVRAGGGLAWLLAVAGVLNSVVSLFYYARVLRAMYLTPATAEGPLVARGVYQGTMVALAIPTVALGVYWGPLYDLLASSLTIAH
jgi:NADH-quinone oxidoreductase subunit N